MKIFRLGRDEPRIYRLVRVYVFFALILQIALGLVMLGFGIVYILLYQTYLAFVWSMFLPMFPIAPHLSAIGGGLCIFFAIFWYRIITKGNDNHLALIASAIIFLLIFPFLLLAGFATLFFLTLPAFGVHLVLHSYYEVITVFHGFSMPFFGIFSLPTLFVLLAGISAELYKILIKPPPPPPTIRESPRGIRTSHGLVAEALRREQDRSREVTD